MNKYAKVIAIDGPSGSGKSTVARKIASELNLLYLDTGAMFRALAVVMNKLGINFAKDNLESAEIKQIEELLAKINFEYAPSEGVLVRIDNQDLTLKIREHEVSTLASQISKFSLIREYLKIKQRDLALKSISVLDGRDIGTVIFPNAAIKIFLTASPDMRAQRRHTELKERDSHLDHSFDRIKRDIVLRDKQDSERDIAPLKKADDAIEIDTTHISIKEVVSRIEELFLKHKERFGIKS